MGRKPLQDPGAFKYPKKEAEKKISQFKEEFNEKSYQEMEELIRNAGFGEMGMGSQLGGHDPNHPLVHNNLNISVNNLAM